MRASELINGWLMVTRINEVSMKTSQATCKPAFKREYNIKILVVMTRSR